MVRLLKALLSIGILFTLFYFLNYRQGMVPPPGKFLNPFAGFWQNNRSLDELPSELTISALQDSVFVIWDDRRVPHIFARNTDDLYFAQGYITARDRLWQMEFQANATVGRLSEIIGASTLEYDRLQRRVGILFAAEQALDYIMQDSTTRRIANAYTAGVNEWISSLNAKTLPVEYKIFDYQPEPWTPLKSALLLKYMAWNLTSYYNRDWDMSNVRAALGDSVADLLFPLHSPFTDPVIPQGTEWRFKPIIPDKPDSQLVILGTMPDSGIEHFQSKGSNNWAVSGKLTSTGYPILCNDPHLALSLPSVWYEIQLVGPESNTYGVSLPGAPTITIGFNGQITWGLTNAGSDVLDLYQITFRDETRSGYLCDNCWLPTTKRIERIEVRGESPVVDTVIYTHHGPVLTSENGQFPNFLAPHDVAIRWTGHDPSNELLAFIELNRAYNYDEFIAAISHYDCPAQNFAYADVGGHVALWHNGKLPRRWQKQGRYILDGSDSDYDWQGFIPQSQLPHNLDPARGFVSSANQNPVDSTYPYYLGWNYEAFERGARINECLAEMKEITPDDMIALQTDLMNLRARKLLPVLTDLLDNNRMTDLEKKCYQELKTWNYEARSQLKAPSIFKRWLNNLRHAIWRDDLQVADSELPMPNKEVTIDLLINQPYSHYFDDKTTQPKESRSDLVWQSFKATCTGFQEEFGDFGPGWNWDQTRGTDIRHLAWIPGLGRDDLPTDGDYGVINATTKRLGPSWRMVVALGPQLKAWGVYPGGQSGNPGSNRYDDFIDKWLNGEMYELIYLIDPHQSNNRLIGKSLLRNIQ